MGGAYHREEPFPCMPGFAFLLTSDHPFSNFAFAASQEGSTLCAVYIYSPRKVL
jgi:hypothetical protein